MNIYAQSDIGLVRDENQDSYFTKDISDTEKFIIVCDGMGGMNCGSLASTMAVDIISQNFLERYNSEMVGSDILSLLSQVVLEANKAVFDKANSDSACSGMGTTVIVALLNDNKLHMVHAGDSRVYIISKDNITQVTKDHSLVQEMHDCGEISAEEMQNHPRKNIITRALGVFENLELDKSMIEIKSDDIILACTDGLTNQLTDQEILSICSKYGLNESLTRLIDQAKSSGGKDNITVVLISR